MTDDRTPPTAHPAEAPKEAAPENTPEQHRAALRRWQRRYEALEGRHAGMRLVMVGMAFLIVGDFAYDWTHELFLGVFPVISVILVIFGVHQYLMAGKEE